MVAVSLSSYPELVYFLPGLFICRPCTDHRFFFLQRCDQDLFRSRLIQKLSSSVLWQIVNRASSPVPGDPLDLPGTVFKYSEVGVTVLVRELEGAF